jgi:hypothetical protein
MRKSLLILFLLAIRLNLAAQNNEPPTPVKEQQIENSTERNDAETNDDSYWQKLDAFRKHRINLNAAEESDLEDLQSLTALQLQNFFSYRRLLGNFLNIYELQAIPGWDMETIRNILPFVQVSEVNSMDQTLRGRLKGGENSLLVRVSRQIEKPKGYTKFIDSSSYYLGSQQKIFFRYKYTYRNLLEYGLLGDKDAGEQFFKGAQKYGFDFYSFHFFSKNMGLIKSLALGDFAVNMGQGLIQWQSLSFTKSADVLFIKRQSAVLRPYNSSGEFNFHRGTGVTLQKGNWEATAFVSIRKISANLVTDTLNGEDFISSFQSSGYHRTQAENADRNKLGQTAYGGNINFRKQNYRISLNVVSYRFSHAVQKQNLPYNLFALQGKSWNNESIDYSITYHNIHFFGETAFDKNKHFAMVNGALISISPRVDISLLHRKIDKAYQSLYSNAFTENTNVNNETGFYSGISLRPFAGWGISVYFDVYKFPWLKYGVDAPGSGKDYLVQFTYQPNKIWTIYTRYKNESKQHNISDTDLPTQHLAFVPKQDWRTETDIHISRELELRNRIEILWYDKNEVDYQQGFVGMIDFFYSPFYKNFSSNVRLQYFETGGYDSRVYAYENDVLFNYSIPSFYGKGFRYYLNLKYNFKKLFRNDSPARMNVETWLRWAQTMYSNQSTVGTGLDEIQGNKKSEIRFQLMLNW